MGSKEITYSYDLSGVRFMPHFGLPECQAHELFVEQAGRTPENAAVISSERTILYAELLRQSRSLGHRLQTLGARPNQLIAIVMEKGWEQILAVVGILASGAAYLPVDPSIPEERLHFLLEDGEVNIVLTQSWLKKKFQWPNGITCLSVDELDLSSDIHEPVNHSNSPDDTAYVLYTSGSTGKPKGVMIGHRGLVNCILETNRTFAVGEKDRALAITALHHDMSVYDIFGPLAVGGAIVMPECQGTRSPDHWLNLIERHHVTVWNSVPAFMEMLLVHAAAQKVRLPGHLRLAFLGGDWIPMTAPARIREHFGDVQVVSVGGPTETTVWNIWYPIQEVQKEWASIPYGHAIANTRYYVLNESLEDCPPGIGGELCCSGVGLLKGYWRNQEQTQARTAIHPRTGERIYRTGDRGRIMPDGEIEFLGRIDRQIKLNGQRIELGEIEAALVRQAGVKQAVADTVDTDGHKKLVAYVVRDRGVQLEARELRTNLEKCLPGYMVPSSFLMLEALPLNTNGKVDRSLLPRPALEKSNVPLAPIGSMEETVSGVWRRLLGLESIGGDDNFFDLGGDSILLVQAHGELQVLLNRTFPVTDLFQFPSVRSLARALEGQATKQLAGADIAERARKQRNAITRQRTIG